MVKNTRVYIYTVQKTCARITLFDMYGLRDLSASRDR